MNVHEHFQFCHWLAGYLAAHRNGPSYVPFTSANMDQIASKLHHILGKVETHLTHQTTEQMLNGLRQYNDLIDKQPLQQPPFNITCGTNKMKADVAERATWP